jgi:chemotaxis protein methyltransferase CheR
MRRTGAPLPEAYFSRISQDASELQRLVDGTSNALSRFFRNPAQLTELLTRVIPQVTRFEPQRVSVWSAGCATGEEPYTVAMLLSSALPRGTEWEIVATDINERALQIGRAAVYAATRIQEVPREYRPCLEQTSDGSHAVDRALVSHVSFLNHSVTDPPPVTGVDIAFCRNVLTYLHADAQRAAVQSLAGAVRAGGYLFIGDSESLPTPPGNWRRVGRAACRLYQRLV